MSPTHPNAAHIHRVVLAKIDGNLGVYDTQEKWLAMLAALISEHGLKDHTKTTGDIPGAWVPLTVQRFERLIRDRVSANPDRWGDPFEIVQTEGCRHYGKAFLDVIRYSYDDSVFATGVGTGRTRQQNRGEKRPEPVDVPTEAVAAVHPPGLLAMELRSSNAGNQSAQEQVRHFQYRNPSLDPEGKYRYRSMRPQLAAKAPEEQQAQCDSGRATVQGNPGISKVALAESQPPKRQKTAHQASMTAAVEQGEVMEIGENGELLPTLDRANKDRRNSRDPTLTPDVSLLAKTIPSLPKDLEKDVAELWTLTQSTTEGMLGSVGEKKAEWVPEPNPELSRVYNVMLGSDWMSRLLRIQDFDQMDRRDLLNAVLATAVYEFVYNQDLPFPGPKEILAGIPDLSRLDKRLHGAGSKETVECALWCIAQDKLKEEPGNTFISETLGPEASKLAGKLMLHLGEQLDRLGASPRSDAQVADIASLVLKAFIFNGKLRAAPHHYESKWPRSGAPYDPKRMKEVYESQSEGQQEVLYTVSPLVVFRETRTARQQMAARAKVVTRPKQSSEQ
ncbi:hypothetical protein LTR27_001589 [Elasticomyces elasticus]|nr:hypothetical protein LTR27_001589 [Elasticomyces elasticus]